MLTVKEWAPVFLFFSGTTTPKFTVEQILREDFAISRFRDSVHCKLCDTEVESDTSDHMKKHARELKKWIKEYEDAKEKARLQRLAEARRLKELQARENSAQS